MPRKAFIADLQKAVAGVSIAGISDVETGNDDGEFTFMCLADGQKLKISVLIPGMFCNHQLFAESGSEQLGSCPNVALIPSERPLTVLIELSDYPSDHMCMIFAPDNAPASVASTLNDISDAAANKTVPQILELVSSRLESTDGDGDQQMMDSQELEDFESEDDDEYEEEYFPGDEDMLPRPLVSNHSNTAPGANFTEATAPFRQRIRRDLLTAKSAGFKVGHLGGLMDGMGCYVSLSIRIAKLGISEEAMQAWQLEPTEYLVAIFHYPSGYKNMDDIKSYDAAQARRNFNIRVGISTSYKPTMQEAIEAFTVLSKDEEKRREASQANDSQQHIAVSKGFRNSFISRPLNELLEQRFHMVLKYRYSGMPWNGAENFYNEQILRPSHLVHAGGSDDKYYEEEHASTLYPHLVTADHIQDSVESEHSLPLVAMQFVLRHFVRCTEFCLICFSKMPDDLQAIKPYVCDNPLCLYQYMSLGFGPSIEHEILSQPKVVDLLLSFCYTSARLGRLRDFPSGLSLAVPPPAASDNYTVLDASNYRHGMAAPGAPAPAPPSVVQHQTAIKARYNGAAHELLFEDRSQPCPVVNANWIVLRTDDTPDRAMHCRILDTSLYPSVRISEPILPVVADLAQQQPYYGGRAGQPAQVPAKPAPTARPPPPKEFRPANFYIYNQNFDDLSDVQKRQAISVLLDMLPPVQEMKKYLLRKAQSPLSSWVDRLSPAALGILRWIIASNRACIVQVDEEAGAAGGRKGEERLWGMAGWAQFRFAMGAPDKERRFIQAVRTTSDRLHLKYPTLFAWHGSPNQNWHSIIREGLHFNEVSHGRAFGNGVYHAPDVQTSLSYSGLSYSACTWPNSELKVQQALALNEIVNAPKEFTSSTPHLVVAQLDWIQTRYLFVKTYQDYTLAGTTSTDKGQKPLEFIEQDPQMTPKGTDGPLIIPIHAISGSRRPKPKSSNVGLDPNHRGIFANSLEKHKRQKATAGSQYDPIEIDDDDDAASIATLDEDRAIFEDDDFYEISLPTPSSVKEDKGKSKLSGFANKLFGSLVPAKPLTDYVPGTLDYKTLPMLEMPAWATSSATRCLMRDFKNLIQVQNSTPAHELGWHIDEDKMENMYQWIVELHSFDSKLPLAQDMKKKDVKSIVLELRFGKEYPMSPPFVRVIRPRFLPFHQGGGGHVTGGGAMCMELLTNDGWSAVSSIESILLQVRMAISSLDPKPARLENTARMDYGVGEAVEAFTRACAMHGWTVPAGFREMALGGTPTGDVNPF
jgi:ubiquitin-conjugating enzyme E2 Q